MHCSASTRKPAQKEKLTAANVVITNNGSYDDLWKQVSEAWKIAVSRTGSWSRHPDPFQARAGSFSLQRGKPRDAQKIADLVTRLSKGKQHHDTG